MKMTKILGGMLVGLIAFALLISIWMPFQEAFRAVFGGFYVLIAPGLVMTYVFFSDEELKFFERLPFAFVFSLATVPLFVFSLFRVGMTVNSWTILAVITGLIIFELIIILIHSRKMLR